MADLSYYDICVKALGKDAADKIQKNRRDPHRLTELTAQERRNIRMLQCDEPLRFVKGHVSLNDF